MDYLHKGLMHLGFDGGELPFAEQKLNAYVDELLLFNRHHRMVNTDDRDEVIVRHVLDCLAGYRFMRGHGGEATSEIVDCGSGAGLPGIPLAIALPDVHFTLIERMANRAAFLVNAASVLRLSNVEVGQYDAAHSKKKHYADIITSRAYSPINSESVSVYRRLAKPGAIAALYKTNGEAETARRLKLENIEAVPLCVPFMEERDRCIVTFVL